MNRNTAFLRSYEDFQASSSVQQDENSETLVINLPGFLKEHIRVQIDGFGNLKVTGERPLVGSINNKWSRFRKDYRIPSNCNPNEIRAKFENGILHIIMPRKPIPEPVQAKPTPKQQAPAPPTPQKPTTTTQPIQKPTTESKVPSTSLPPPVPKPSTESISEATQQNKPSQKPVTESKYSSTTQPEPSKKPVTESIHKPSSTVPEPIQYHGKKERTATPMPQAPSTSLKPIQTQLSHEPNTTESKVSPKGPTPLAIQKPTTTESIHRPQQKVPQPIQSPTSNDKTTQMPQAPPSQVASTPIPEVIQRKKPDNESNNADNSNNNNNGAQRSREETKKIAKEKEEKKNATENLKGKSSSSTENNHGLGLGSGFGRTLDDYIDVLAMELKKPRTQLAVNVVVASIVVVGLMTWTINCHKKN